MAFVTENWHWLLVFASAVGILIVTLIKEENPNSKWKTWWNIGLLVLGVAGGIGSMANTYQNQIDPGKMKATIDSSKTIIESAKRLSELDSAISTQINSVQKLHIKLDSATNKLTLEGNKLTNQNLASTRNINYLTENAKFLLEGIYDEQIGGNSIPLISAYTFEDYELPFDYIPIDKRIRYPNMYVESLDLYNTGDYKLTDVTITSRVDNGKAGFEDTLVLTSNLAPKQLIKLRERVLAPLLSSLNPSDTNQTYSFFEETVSNTPYNYYYNVYWRNLHYEYAFRIDGNLTKKITVAELYTYKTKEYKNGSELIAAILQERTIQKQKRLKLSN